MNRRRSSTAGAAAGAERKDTGRQADRIRSDQNREARQVELSRAYDPEQVEGKWYRYWEDLGLFRAEVDPERRPFSIVIPPPNVTGSLHMGHALDNTLQDILTRWHRMRGYRALWLPGTDHAGIATQHVVEKRLAREGLNRHDLGRERFLNRVWEWKDEYEATILNQLKRLGASCDWSRTRFTMDQGCSLAVRKVFVSLFEKGLIYQGDYIINWCPDCATALSDLEVEHEEDQGRLYYLRYPLVDEEGRAGTGAVTVATTRPETMLGDTAVAVHPDDERYRHLVGKKAVLPLVGRFLPIIADQYVDPAFGTGAVKVTPAHDPNDFEMGQRHGLESVAVIGRDGLMTAEAGRFAGMDRYRCRQALVEALEAGGYLLRVEDYQHATGRCYRCGTVVEPLVSRQWFVRMKPLAGPALKAVEEGRVRFVPERFARVYLHWMENVRDWCISRQIWWGHRIPAWYCDRCGGTTVAVEDPSACGNCGGGELRQDPDVLDTWFSSALWPFSTMGWPERTPELSYFFPTSILVTGYDIIFFWVARMIFMALEFMGDVPFRYVLIHGLVRDAQGRKMSKSLGTGIDPLEVIDRYGADTLRFTLITGNTPGHDMRFHQERVEASRNFCNKIWNAARFVLLNLGDMKAAAPDDAWFSANLTLPDRWILSRYARLVSRVNGLLEEFDLGEAARQLYDFLWSEYCDWYIELAKPRLSEGAEAGAVSATRCVLWHVLEGTLRLLHPFLPFITEAIWQTLPRRPGSPASIVTAPYPSPAEVQAFLAPEDEDRMALVMEVVRAIRNLRAELKVPPTRKTAVEIQATSAEARSLLTEMASHITVLAQARPLKVEAAGTVKPRQALAAIVPGAEVYLPLKGVVDVGKERARLENERADVEKDLERTRQRLENANFRARAPAEVVRREEDRRVALEEQLAGIRHRLRLLDD